MIQTGFEASKTESPGLTGALKVGARHSASLTTVLTPAVFAWLVGILLILKKLSMQEALQHWSHVLLGTRMRMYQPGSAFLNLTGESILQRPLTRESAARVSLDR